MGGGSESNTVNEGDYLLKTLENERNVYSTLLEDTSISYQQREILETKYEVIQEALGVAIIAAVIAAVGALILLIAKVMKSTSSASNTVKTKIKEVNKKLEDKIDEIKAEPNSYEGELGDDGLTDAQRAATDKALSKFDSNNNMSDEDHTEFERKFGKQKNNKERGEHGKGDRKLTRSDISQELKVRNKFKMELKKSIKEYTIIKDVFDKYKDEFKKLCEESFDNSFPGFSSMDLLVDVNKECIREFERDTRMTAMDSKSFDEYDDIKNVTYDDKNRYETSNKDYVKKYMDIDSMECHSGKLSEQLKNDTFNIIFTNRMKMDFSKQERENNRDALTYIYDCYKNEVRYYKLTEPSDAMNRNISMYFKFDTENKTEDVLRKLSNDLKQLEKTLKRLKETNFNKSKIDDNNKTSKDKQNSDNYLQNMLYIDKYAVSILSSFINGIHNLEIKRASFAAQYWGLYARCVNKYIGRSNQSANNIKSVKKG